MGEGVQPKIEYIASLLVLVEGGHSYKGLVTESTNIDLSLSYRIVKIGKLIISDNYIVRTNFNCDLTKK